MDEHTCYDASMVPLKPLWWWSMAEDGQPGRPIERTMTSEQMIWVMPTTLDGVFVELRGTNQGYLGCALKKPRKRSA